MGVETRLVPYGQNRGAFPSADIHTFNNNTVSGFYDDRGFMKSGMTSREWEEEITEGEHALK